MKSNLLLVTLIRTGLQIVMIGQIFVCFYMVTLYCGQLVSKILYHFKGLLNDLRLDYKFVLIFKDNLICIEIAKNRECKRLKRIDVKHHFIRDTLQNRDIIKYIPSSKQKAEILTKVKICSIS